MLEVENYFDVNSENSDSRKRFLRENASLLKRNQTLLLISIDGIHIVDKVGNIIEANDAFCQLLGYSKEEILKKTVFDIDALISKEEFSGEIEQLKNKARVFQTKHRKKDGTLIDVEINAVGVNFDGIEYVYASSRDISSRVQEVKIKADALDHLNKIASRVPGVLYQYVLRPDGSSHFPFASAGVQDIYGVSPDEIVNDASVVFKRIYKDDLEGVIQSITASAKNLTPWQHEYRVQDDDGTIRLIYGNSIPQKEPDGSILWHGFITDITLTKRAENQLAELANRYKQLFDSHSSVMLLIDVNSGYILDVNISALNFYGYSKEQLKNMNIAEINILNKEAIKQEMELAFLEKRNYFIFKHKLANGELKDVEVHSTPMIINGKETLFSVIHDISERKKSEQIVLEYTHKLQRLNTDLESFAYVASHDLKAPLNVVTGFLGLMNSKNDQLSNETREEYLKYIQNAVDQMKLLINDLLQFSRIGSNKDALSEIDLNELLMSVQSILKETILQNNATIKIQPLPTIMANKTLLNELFMNLLGNALKYHKPKQEVFIEIGYREAGDKYQFYVKDNGIGIAVENLEKVFIMFKRLHTNSEYQGTGIGLALCKRIVEAHGGEIWIESVLGEGSTFYFTIKKSVV
jgi:PAS domain S-box-containing protein